LQLTVPLLPPMNCHGLVGTGVVGASVVGAWVVGRAVVAVGVVGAMVMTDGATVMAFTSAFAFTSADVVGDEVVDIGTVVATCASVADGGGGAWVGDPSYSMCMLVFIFTLLRRKSAICENRSGGVA